MNQPLGDIDGGALGASGLQFGNDLQDGPALQRMYMRRRESHPSAGSR